MDSCLPGSLRPQVGVFRVVRTRDGGYRCGVARRMEPVKQLLGEDKQKRCLYVLLSCLVDLSTT